MDQGLQSPRIGHLCCGRLEVAGRGAFKTPSCIRAARANGTGARSEPGTCRGIQPADVQELLERGAKILVLSRGMLGRLQICPETLALLERKGIPARVLPTGEAVRLDNDLAAKDQVGCLFHSTC